MSNIDYVEKNWAEEEYSGGMSFSLLRLPFLAYKRT
jgi:hypothetical protein